MKFTPLQLSYVMVLNIGIFRQIIVLPHLLSIAKRDAWVCTIFSYLVLSAWGWLIYKIMRKTGSQALFEWVKERAGTTVSVLIVFLLYLYVLIYGLNGFYEVMQVVKVYYLPRTPLFVIALSFLLLSVLISIGGLKTIVYMSILLLPLVLILELFVVFATFKSKEYSYLFPVMIHGYRPLIKGTLVSLGGNVQLLVLFLLGNRFKSSFSKTLFFGLIMMLVTLLLLPVTDMITTFGPNVSANLRFPAFEQWRLVTLGAYVTHVDFISVLQLLSGVAMNVSLCIVLFSHLVEKISEKMVSIGKLIMVAPFFSTIFINDTWVRTTIGTFIAPYTFVYGTCITVMLFLISYLPKSKGVPS